MYVAKFRWVKSVNWAIAIAFSSSICFSLWVFSLFGISFLELLWWAFLCGFFGTAAELILEIQENWLFFMLHNKRRRIA